MMAGFRCLDLFDTEEGSEIFRPAEDRWGWTAADIDPEACIVRLDEACMNEITAMVEHMDEHRLPVLLRAPDHFEMPHLRGAMARVKSLLDTAPGLAVIDGLPLDDLDDENATAIFWVLGHLVDRPVAQKWDGTFLYDVRDTALEYGYGVRGSFTNVTLTFHIDNAFGRAPPDFVGLLCRRPAFTGGTSRFAGLSSLHQRMLQAHPRLLARLYRPMLWDRQAEHAADAPKVARAPMFSVDGGRLRARVNLDLVRKGYQIAGQNIDNETADALDAFGDLASDSAHWIELPVQRGHCQFLNNRNLVHYRSGFTDHEDPALKRHLIRTWHRGWGAPSYDG